MIDVTTRPGTLVYVRDDHGRERTSITRSKPWRTSAGDWCVLLRGHGVRGCFALERVRLATDDEVRA